MTISSMTGFARVEGAYEAWRWVWEVRSVNGRGLETRFRLPPGHDGAEPALRKAVGDAFTRGSINATLNLSRAAGLSALRINEAALDEALRMIEQVRMRLDCEKPRAEGVLGLRGVIEIEDGGEDEEARAALAAAIVDSFRAALNALKKARAAEGKALAAVVAAQVDEIARLAGEARCSAGAAPEAIRARIAAQLADMLSGNGFPEERLAQEAALLAIKADVREELDRLDAHVEAARALLSSGDPVGRRLDFLMQEFNREANTLCSKVSDMALKRLGLDLKTVIDQMREQVQNIE
jgi:uncharacterized protein (TIGR00255 family)